MAHAQGMMNNKGLLIHCMVQSPGLQLVKKFSAFHGTRRFITALTSVPPPVSILDQPNSVHMPTSHLLEIHPNIIRPLRLGLPSGLLPSGLPTKTLYTPLSSPIRATCPANPSLLDFISIFLCLLC